jgi:hypothetical protein
MEYSLPGVPAGSMLLWQPMAAQPALPKNRVGEDGAFAAVDWVRALAIDHTAELPMAKGINTSQ